MKKFSIFGADTEEKVLFNEEEDKTNVILDEKLMKYIMKQFPEVATDIRDSLLKLKDTLESSIDYIEEKSSEVIKATRDFDLSGQYRDTSIQIHEISNDLEHYVGWMNEDLCSGEIVKDSKEDNIINEKSIESFTEEKSNNLTEEKINSIINPKIDNSYPFDQSLTHSTYIFEDFTSKHPHSFNLEKHHVEVDSWDDMIVKTADILTKHYKENRYVKNKSSTAIMPVNKKSKQNDYRDTIIDMLNEYNINLKNFRVLLR